ncbi:MAG: acyl-CoA dehydrogenase family protein, partial [Methylobacter sp.]
MIWLIALLILVGVLAYGRASLRWTTLVLFGWLGLYSMAKGGGNFVFLLWVVFDAVFIPLNVPAIRKRLFSRVIFKIMKKMLPQMSQTEREALEAGNTWWDAELFSGNPDWKVLLDLPAAKLTAEERAFIDGPVETLCSMLDDWDITHNRRDLPEEVWDYIKVHKFCGMIIPKRYGGLEFGEYAHSEIVMKISSRSSTAAVTVMV